MKTLHTRLDERKDEILLVTETFGVFRGMYEAGVSSYDRFRLWLRDVTGNENFGLHPKLNPNSDQTLGDQLVDAVLRKVTDLEAQLKERDKRIRFLEWTLSVRKGKEDKQALAVLELCQG